MRTKYAANEAHVFKSLRNGKLGVVNVVDDVTVNLFKLLHNIVHTALQYLIGNAVKQKR